ncbi:VanZ family protein [Paenibacillus sp. FSL W7-1287]|uniref:VanZ family protein n=1 Tax=Paenibacillus sp. FSL W7-1287 TaxID=2954538 RepID=UPI0030F7F16A
MNKIFVKIAVALLGFYTLLLSYWMLIGFGRRSTSNHYMINLRPFETISHFMQFDRFNTSIWVVNLIGNIAVFVPFGVLLPIVFGKRIGKTYFVFFVGLLILEGLQLVSRRGSFDIDDFILNSVGFFFGYGIFRLLYLIKMNMKRPSRSDI